MAQYAQILDGFVANVIVLDDPSIINLFFINPLGGPNFDYVNQIDNLSIIPQIGWSYTPAIYPNADIYTSPDGSIIVNGNE
jgi:hypothetical protein